MKFQYPWLFFFLLWNKTILWSKKCTVLSIFFLQYAHAFFFFMEILELTLFVRCQDNRQLVVLAINCSRPVNKMHLLQLINWQFFTLLPNLCIFTLLCVKITIFVNFYTFECKSCILYFIAQYTSRCKS